MENPIQMDDLGVPLFWETPISYIDHPFFSQPHVFFFAAGILKRGRWNHCLIAYVPKEVRGFGPISG